MDGHHGATDRSVSQDVGAKAGLIETGDVGEGEAASLLDLSPVAANGYIYFTCLDGGAVTVLKAGTGKPEVVARNPELGERVAASPAIADDTIYIRTAGHLYAFAEKK